MQNGLLQEKEKCTKRVLNDLNQTNQHLKAIKDLLMKNSYVQIMRILQMIFRNMNSLRIP